MPEPRRDRTNDFSVEYVWAYSSRDLDLFYKFSSFWGGQKGSLLFWTLLLTTYMLIVYVQNRGKNMRVVPVALVVMIRSVENRRSQPAGSV